MDARHATLAHRAATPSGVRRSLHRAPALVRGRGWWLLGLAAVALAGSGLAELHVWPPLATVMSGSMAPTINTGDVVVLKRVEGAPHVGDVVAVTVPDDARTRYGYPSEVVHRVVRVAPGGTIVTKGDARPRPDPFTVPRSAVRAEVVATVPAAGRVLAFLTSGLGLLWLATGAILLIVMPAVDRRRDTQRREHDGFESISAHLRSLSDHVERLHIELAARARRDEEIEHRLSDLITDAAAVASADAGTAARRAPSNVEAPSPLPASVPSRRRTGGLLGSLIGSSRGRDQ